MKPLVCGPKNANFSTKMAMLTFVACSYLLNVSGLRAQTLRGQYIVLKKVKNRAWLIGPFMLTNLQKILPEGCLTRGTNSLVQNR